HIQIALRPAPQARFAVAAGAQPRPGIHARRDAQLDLGRHFAPAAAVTGLARFLQDAPRAFATRAGLRNAENSPRTDDLAPSAASRARPALRARLRSRTVADIAPVVLGDRDFLFATVRGFLERDFHVVAQIGAPLRLRRVGTAAAAKQILKNAAAAKHLAKNVRRIMKAATSPAATAAHAGVERRMSITVIGGAFLRVAQGLVSLAQFLELFLRGLVARIFVRMELHSQLAVGFFNFLHVGLPLHTENLVIIALGHGIRRQPSWLPPPSRAGPAGHAFCNPCEAVAILAPRARRPIPAAKPPRASSGRTFSPPRPLPPAPLPAMPSEAVDESSRRPSAAIAPRPATGS